MSRTKPGPIAPVSRIVEVDMVRGFALFGVLLVNLYGFGADSVAWNSPIDQLPPSGTLYQWTQQPIPGRFGVRLELDASAADLTLPAGTAGAAAVYTERAAAMRIIRQVAIRTTIWLNYVIL